ncbi:heme steroid bindingprotein [Ophiostoma piceae UAMH 11346]|uniref:Heme steroid bindingprotein n=1 Tax=Ophiostoma piceae (strain UAMH 11346) TaxID=1262450 RepID=S3C9A3_OPHP1|nr:heme steroid bindingprotein [Ophiostoma piceae UAMH 11346]
MGVIGVSLILASIVLLIMYPQSWRQLAQPFFQWRGQAQAAAEQTTAEAKDDRPSKGSRLDGQQDVPAVAKVERDRLAMPPPPPIIRSEPPKTEEVDDDEDDEAATPKATPTVVIAAVPTFSLSEPGIATNNDGDDSDSDPDTDNMPPPMFPSPFSAQRAGASADPSRGSMAPPPRPAATSPSLSAPSSRPGMMAPPPVPSQMSLGPPQSAAAAARRQPALPVPNRGPPRSSLAAPSLRPPVLGGSLAPPPSTTVQPTRPAKSGRNKVMLTPGHSPLDWARLTADPIGNNLRGSGVPADAPYLLRITPSQLKQMNGRKGRDAWTALGGMVYNMTPYVPFHPGGAGELLRCAGKDGNKLFNEVHSWVNYENMLAACRVGILVEEGASTTSPMEEMD